MRKKWLCGLFFCVTFFASLFFSSCDSLWKVSDSTSVSFKIDMDKELAELLPRTIDGTKKLDVTVSLYNANATTAFTSKVVSASEPLSKLGVRFSDIRVGSRIYATVVIKDGNDFIFNGRSDVITVKADVDNILVIEEVIEEDNDDDDNIPIKTMSFYVANDGKDDTGDGTIDAPWASLQKAVDHIIDINDEETRYVIIVSGEIIDEGTSGKGANGYDDAMVEIEVLDGSKLNLVIEGDSANAGIINAGAVFTTTVDTTKWSPVTIGVSNEGLAKRVFYIDGDSNVNVIFGENLTIKGGTAFKNLYYELYDEYGDEIEPMYSLYSGGGVYILGANVILEGTTISHNFTTNYDANAPSYGAYYNGGGVCVDSGILTMNSGLITENAADEYGGGVVIANDGEFIMNGSVTDSIVSHNKSKQGSAVSTKGSSEGYYPDPGDAPIPTFTMNGGIITEHHVFNAVETSQSGRINLFGGSITGNTSGSGSYPYAIGGDDDGDTGEINIKGDPIITGNLGVLTDGDTPSIPYNMSTKTVFITGSLTGTPGSIGVTPKIANVAEGKSHTISQNDLKVFAHDAGETLFLNTVDNRIETQTTFYVSEGGFDDTGDGTEGNPWASVQKAVDHIVGPDVLSGINDRVSDYTIVVSGTVAGFTSIDLWVSLSLTIKGSDEGGILSPSASNEGVLSVVYNNIRDYDLAYITLGENLTITGADISGNTNVVNVKNADGWPIIGHTIFTIDGTSITNNSNLGGYGLNIEDITLNLQGNTTIYNNLYNGDQSNINTDAESQIFITGPLADGNFIGITPSSTTSGDVVARAGKFDLSSGQFLEDTSINLADYNVDTVIQSDRASIGGSSFEISTSEKWKLIIQ